MHILGFLYSLKDKDGLRYGGHVIGAPDAFLIQHLPHSNELEAHGYKRYEMTRGKKNIIDALQDMNRPTKRAKTTFSFVVKNHLPSCDVLVRNHVEIVDALDRKDAVMNDLWC